MSAALRVRSQDALGGFLGSGVPVGWASSFLLGWMASAAPEQMLAAIETAEAVRSRAESRR